MAPAPFASWQGVGAWTGHRAIIVSPEVRRAASYDPVDDRWRNLPRPPRPFPAYGAAFWTGREVVFVGGYPSGDDSKAATIGVAYDPHAGTWRRLPRSPLDAYDGAVWAGGRVIVTTTSDGGEHDDGIGAYDPARDCWSVLPLPPILTPWGLTGAGDHLVASGTEFPGDAPRTIAVMDMGTLTWGPPMMTPLDADAAPLLWTGGDRLLTLAEPQTDSGAAASGPPGLLDATVDAATALWTPLTASCPMNTREALWTGRIVLDSDLAFDEATEACYTVPPSHDRHRRDPLQLWTGREAIIWSGGGGEEIPPTADGVIYGPPAWATEPGVDPVGRGAEPW